MAILLTAISPLATASAGSATSVQLSSRTGSGDGSSSANALQARAAEIASRIGSEAVEIHSLAEQYLTAKTLLASIQADQAGTMVRAALARAQFAAARSTLTQAVIAEYVNSGSTVGPADFVSSNAAGTSAAVEGQAYLAVVAARAQLDDASLEAATTRLDEALTAQAASRRAAAQALAAKTLPRSACGVLYGQRRETDLANQRPYRTVADRALGRGPRRGCNTADSP